MAECSVCGAEASVSDACPHCARPVCEEHRPPDAHDCPGVRDDAARRWYTDPDAGRASAGTGLPELSNPRRLAVGVLLVAVVAVAAMAAFAAVGVPTAGIDAERTERLVAQGANDARTERGLDPLGYDPELAAVAETHSQRMATAGFVNHTWPDGTTVADRYAAAGIDCRGGENVYFTPNGALRVSEAALADAVVRAWLGSPGHRAALLDADHTKQGIGIVVDEDGGVYVTQDFC
ncbi:CAP domain-containing protein [Halorarius halobius]|uniref:CAP domain-containing protein n=1 Tax=Halorarius halobius TaxID=2962671 RepID=UPI0020CEF14E|nr:CAP domain-containing protein [Halorarius halobius]